MGSLSEEERPAAGKLANEVREAIESALKSKKDAFEDALLKEKLSAQSIDISLDNRKFPVGHHPLYKTIRK
jgi:phenylalanyl-tRNA synthetase alpha chain